jgi:hypothetical protein
LQKDNLQLAVGGEGALLQLIDIVARSCQGSSAIQLKIRTTEGKLGRKPTSVIFSIVKSMSGDWFGVSIIIVIK